MPILPYAIHTKFKIRINHFDKLTIPAFGKACGHKICIFAQKPLRFSVNLLHITTPDLNFLLFFHFFTICNYFLIRLLTPLPLFSFISLFLHYTIYFHKKTPLFPVKYSIFFLIPHFSKGTVPHRPGAGRYSIYFRNFDEMHKIHFA